MAEPPHNPHAPPDKRLASRLEVAVAGMNLTDPDGLITRLGLSDTPARVLVVNQITDRNAGGPVPTPIDRGRVRMLSFAERGIARSRNRAIEWSRGEVLLFADDDIHCHPQAFPEVLAAFDAHPAAAAITFRCAGLGHRYPRLPQAHGPVSVASVSSVEIAVAPARLGTVRFDPSFGLGTERPSGEEAIFLRDLQRAGAAVRFAPVTICHHGHTSSGQGPWDPPMTRTKGAVMRRMYPRTWPLPLAYLAATKRRTHAPGTDAISFGRTLLQGALQETPHG